MSNLRAVRNNILFKFTDDIESGQFKTVTESGIVVVEAKDKQMDKCRWGKVISVGPDAKQFINEGQYVLVGALRWTNHIEYDNQKIWMTNSDEVIAVSDEEIS